MIAQAPFTTPDAWLGADLQMRRDWIISLSPEDIAELRAALAVAHACGRNMSDWTRDDFPLPRLGRRIGEWLVELDRGRSFVLLRGFPVSEHTKDDCAGIYWGLGLHMGRAISQNTDGDLLGHVRDTGADPHAYGVRLYKTRAEQDFHTDGADVIGLFCLRAARSGGVSRIVSSVSIFNEMLRRRPDLVPTLFEPFPFDTQGQHKPGAQPWFDFPICQMANGRVSTFFAPWYIRESQQHAQAPRLTEAQEEAISFIETVANDPQFYLDMHFEPGDMQFLRNAAVLHKRTDYEDWDEPDAKRHLLRLWLVEPSFTTGNEFLRSGIERRDEKTTADPRSAPA